MSRSTCNVPYCGTHRWPVRNENLPHVVAETVAPEPGVILGAVLTYADERTGKRWAAVAECIDGDVWTSHRGLPENPAPAWVDAVKHAREFIDGGTS